MTAVSIVIPAYSQAALLIRLLDALLELAEGPSWEVLVIDDASTDETAQDAQAWFAAHSTVRGRYILQPQNQGPGAARNRGLEAAGSPLVAFIDTDCVPDPGWLNGLLTALGTDSTIAGVGGAVRPYNPESVFARYNTVNGTLQPIVAPDYAIPYLVTCNCCFRRDALLAAGAFPTDIARPGGEDIAASIALYKMGYRFAFAANATMQHDFRDTLRSFLRTWTNYGYGCGLIVHRMLSQEELNPEWGQWNQENYWGVQAVRPTLTGVRSTLKDLRWFWKRCHERDVSLPQRLPLMALRFAERIAYYRGWRSGVQRAEATRHTESP